MKRVLCLSLIIGLVGCATTPTDPSDVKLASHKRLYDQNLYKPSKLRTVPVTITRDTGALGSLATTFFKIDGEYVVWLNMMEEITIYLAPGGYVFEVENGVCPDVKQCKKSLDVTIKNGFSNNFRIAADEGFEIIRSNT